MCSQLLFSGVLLGVVVLLYITTSAHCEKLISKEEDGSLIMGERQPDDQLLYNGTIKSGKVEPNETLYEYFRWPEFSERVVHTISMIEVNDKGKGGEVYLYTGGPEFEDVELHISTEKGEGYEFDIMIYGYKREMIDD